MTNTGDGSKLLARHSSFALVASALAGAAIPISTALQNLSALLLLIAFAFLPKKWKDVREVYQKPFPFVGLVLGVLLVFGSIWSIATFSESWDSTWKMRAFYFIPIFSIIFSHHKVRSYFLVSFFACTILSVLLSCLSAWLNRPFFLGVSGDWFVFRTHTYHNFFAAVSAVMILTFLLTNKMPKKHQFFLMFLFFLISYDIFFLVAGRTGQIAYVLMLGLVFVMWQCKLGLKLFIIILAVLSFSLPNYSSVFNSGINQIKNDLSAFQVGNSNTSIGIRLEWREKSLQLIKEKPLTGYGTGSFQIAYNQINSPESKHLSTRNPHNDYLLLSVELGVVGGLLLVGLLLAAAWQGRHLRPAWRLTLYALLLGMGTSTLANSFFTDNISGLAFVLLTCALLNGPRCTESE